MDFQQLNETEIYTIRGVYKDKNNGREIANFQTLTKLNTDLKILTKVLARHLQAVLASLLALDQMCAVRGRTIQDNLHLVSLIIEQVDSEAPLISLYHCAILLPLYPMAVCTTPPSMH